MKKYDLYKAELERTRNWLDYLKNNSMLPGRRANLELLEVIVDLGNEDFFTQCLQYENSIAPGNTPGEFIAMCGTAGLSKLILQGQVEYYSQLKSMASDARWRVREAVGFAFQRIAKENFKDFIEKIQNWKNGTPYEKRALGAGICEPAVMFSIENTDTVFSLLTEFTLSVPEISQRETESKNVLKKGLGYGWSVAIVASPEKGKKIFEQLTDTQNQDIKWILKENLKKNRLVKMDLEWVQKMKNLVQ